VEKPKKIALTNSREKKIKPPDSEQTNSSNKRKSASSIAALENDQQNDLLPLIKQIQVLYIYILPIIA